MAGTTSTAPRPSTSDQPKRRTVQVGAEGRRQRARAVDGEADGEGPVATPDVAELGAHEHEGGHDQGVGRDGQLDALDGRVEVRRDLRDRDVHDAAVEHHHELRRGEDDDRQPIAHRQMVAAADRLDELRDTAPDEPGIGTAVRAARLRLHAQPRRRGRAGSLRRASLAAGRSSRSRAWAREWR